MGARRRGPSDTSQRPGRASRSAVLLAIALVAVACGGPTDTIRPSTAAPSAAAASAGAAGSPAPTGGATGPTSTAPTQTASASAAGSCVDRVLAGMTPAQRIGQLFLLGLAGDRLGPAEIGAIRNQHVGSVWFTATTSIGAAGVLAVADAVQALADARSTADVGFFVAANQEGGLVQALRGAGFSTIPSALVQGKLPLATLKADAARWGRELTDAGVNLDFAPVADVVPLGDRTTNQPIGVLRREYGATPATAGSHAAAFVTGMTDAAVATTAKHFPGLGRVVGNTDVSSGVVDDVTTADDADLASFKAEIDAGVPFVMVALARYQKIDPGHLAAFSAAVIDDMLRRDLGFTGVVMSDDLGATEAVASMPPGERAVDFLLAGGDLVVSKTVKSTVAMIAALKARAATDPTFAVRIDDSARRVLEAKAAAGLLPCSG